MNPLELLGKLPAKSVPDLLALLARCYEQSDDPASPRLPLVTLHLRNGRDLSGRIVKLGTDSDRGRTLLLQSATLDGRAPEAAAMYVPLDSVEAVSVRDPEQVADLLSDGALSTPASSVPAPSRLDIVRAADELSKTLAKDHGVTLKVELDATPGMSGEALRSLSVLVRWAFTILTEIAGDALGKESLSAVANLRISNGETPSVQLKDRELKILAALAKGHKGRLSQTELKSRIQSVL